MNFSNQLAMQKVSEMNLASKMPAPPRGTMGAAATPPVFFDANGNVITGIDCGQPYTFDVPGSGLSQIWLTEYKNGQKTYDNVFSLPMPSYVSSCENDIGTYQVIAYDLDSGLVLGQTTFTIYPAGTTVPASGSTSITSSLSNFWNNLSTIEKVLLVGGGAFLLMKK